MDSLRLYSQLLFSQEHVSVATRNLEQSKSKIHLFISSQHPDVDSSTEEVFDGLGDAVLELVLDAGGANQL